MPELTTEQRINAIESKVKQVNWLWLVIAGFLLIVGVWYFFGYQPLLRWAGNIDGPRPNWGDEAAQEGKLASYLSHMDEELHDHLKLQSPAAHSPGGGHDRHTDPPPPPKW